MAAKELLKSVFDQRKATYPSALSEDDAFEVFCADVILNSFNPSIEEIQDRVVDGGQDGGIDSVFVYVNRVLVSEDTDLSVFKFPVDVELVVIQSKNEDTFKEGPIDKIAASLPNLIRDFGKISQGSFNARLVSAFSLWDKVLTNLAPEFPNFKIGIWYACRGEKVPGSASAKADTLAKTIQASVPNSKATLTFAGANDLYSLAAQQKVVKADLKISGSPLSGPNSAYIVLSTLSDYGAFITDSNGVLKSSFFDANVRDYEGSVDVNKDIASTLRSPLPGIDFWWMNNGVTVLASKAGFSNGAMTLQNPLIVNGLQTSYELHRWLKEGGSDQTRLVMVRIIETTDEDVINKVVKATNYQSKVKSYSLRATEEVQRKIELYLLSGGIFYDRRRNYYKNLGKPAGRTLGIDRMAQAVTSILLEQPQVARARPTSLMKPDVYDKLFPADDDAYPLAVYRLAAEALFKVAAHFSAAKYDRVYSNNLRFHVLMALGWWAAGSQNPKPEQLASIDLEKIGNAPLDKIAEWVISEFDKTDANDAVAKDAKFTEQLRSKWASVSPGVSV